MTGSNRVDGSPRIAKPFRPVPSRLACRTGSAWIPATRRHRNEALAFSGFLSRAPDTRKPGNKGRSADRFLLSDRDVSDNVSFRTTSGCSWIRRRTRTAAARPRTDAQGLPPQGVGRHRRRPATASRASGRSGRAPAGGPARRIAPRRSCRPASAWPSLLSALRLRIAARRSRACRSRQGGPARPARTPYRRRSPEVRQARPPGSASRSASPPRSSPEGEGPAGLPGHHRIGKPWGRHRPLDARKPAA